MKKIILAVCIAALVLTGCTAKPSKADVKKAFKASLEKELGATAKGSQKEAIGEYSDCVVDETYDKLSAKTLKKFIDAKNTTDFKNVSGTSKEKDQLEKAAEKCAKVLLEAAGQ